MFFANEKVLVHEKFKNSQAFAHGESDFYHWISISPAKQKKIYTFEHTHTNGRFFNSILIFVSQAVQ